MSDNQQKLNPINFIDPIHQYGLLRATTPDRSVYLVGKLVGGMPLLDGASDMQRSQAASTMMNFFDGLASLVPLGAMKYRNMYKSDYRRFKILGTGMPHPYQAPPQMRGTELGRFLNQNFRNYMYQKQSIYFAVPLHEKKRKDGNEPIHTKNNIIKYAEQGARYVARKLDSFASVIANGGLPFEDYLDDAELIAGIMSSAGILPFTELSANEINKEIDNMRAWWVASTHNTQIPVMYEDDHLHAFPNKETALHAKKLFDEGVDCHEWNIPQELPISLLSAQSTEYSENKIMNVANEWVARLMAVYNAGGVNAVGFCIQGLVEPAKITQAQIVRNTRSVDEMIARRMKRNQEPTGDMNEISRRLNYKRSIYENKDMPPTLIDMSVTVAVAGDAEQAMKSVARLSDMTFKPTEQSEYQRQLFQSMQICSPVQYSPYNLEWSSTMVAGAGLASFTSVGDSQGALLGFTELNRQPVYLSPTLAQDEDRKPFTIIVARTGAGKTMTQMMLALQYARIRTRAGIFTPVRLINFKQGSDFTNAILNRGGKVYNLDNDIADGTFDPLRVVDPIDAKNMSVTMLTSIMGADKNTETSLMSIIDYGIQHGKTTTGTALQAAYQNYINGNSANLPDNTQQICEMILRYAKVNDLFRLIFGMSEDSPHLNMDEGLSLIQVGKRDIMPSEDESDTSMTQKIKQWVMRLIILGVGNTVRGKDGVVIIDEAWAALGSGAGTIVDQWGRLAREQRMNFIFGSQKAREFIEAKLEGAVQRVLIMAMDDRSESNGNVSQAREALRLAAIDDSDNAILSRMPLDDTVGGDNEHQGQPNWRSLRALREPGTRRVIRGAIGYLKDGDKPPVAVEITVPEGILKDISTTAIDKDIRSAESKKPAENISQDQVKE